MTQHTKNALIEAIKEKKAMHSQLLDMAEQYRVRTIKILEEEAPELWRQIEAIESDLI